MLAWVCTEAVRTQNRELVLGRSLSEFMRTLDIYGNSSRVHTRLPSRSATPHLAAPVQPVWSVSGQVKRQGVAGLPGYAAKHMPDWSKVQAVPPGKPTTVLLYKDEAPRGSRKIKGLFDSATVETITLMLEDGQTRTLQKQSVRKVLTRRPFAKRWMAQQCDVERQPEAVLRAPARTDQIKIIIGQKIVALQRSDVGGNSE